MLFNHMVESIKIFYKVPLFQLYDFFLNFKQFAEKIYIWHLLFIKDLLDIRAMYYY
jgi:hypothetical protein